MRVPQLKHRLALRWMHWLNFPLLGLMLWSGLLIYWANDVYAITLGGHRFHFFPHWIYQHLHLHYRLAEGMAVHFTLMWPFVLNGVAYLCFTGFSGEWRELIPNRQSWREAVRVLLHELRLSKKPVPQAKFNAAQRIAYSTIILCGAASVLTGLAIYKPTQLAWLTRLLGGYQAARAEHFILAMIYAVFFVVHVAQVAKAGWNNFRAMVSGYAWAEKETAP